MPTKKLTKRWLYNNFLVILIFLSALIIAFSLAIRNYYYNSVLSVMKNTATVQNASLVNYSEDNTVDFSASVRRDAPRAGSGAFFSAPAASPKR